MSYISFEKKMEYEVIPRCKKVKRRYAQDAFDNIGLNLTSLKVKDSE